MFLSEWIKKATSTLNEAGIFSSDYDAKALLAHVKGVSLKNLETLLVMQPDPVSGLTPAELAKAEILLSERASRVPLQHLTGKAPFRNIELSVGPGVFTPRPETEVVTQFAIDELSNVFATETLAVDFCTGSGAIALALVNEVANVKVFAVEVDDSAYAWAERNIELLGENRVTLLKADVTKPIAELKQLTGQFDVVISNPPYVPQESVPIDPEVRDHDPAMALYSGADGLDVIRSLSVIAKPLLREGGLLVLEHAEHQGESVRNILERHGWSAASTHQDLTRRDRVTVARA